MVKRRGSLSDEIGMTSNKRGKTFNTDDCHHYPDPARSPLRRTVQNWLVTYHQYIISAVVPQIPFRREISGVVAKCRLLCQAAMIAFGRHSVDHHGIMA